MCGMSGVEMVVVLVVAIVVIGPEKLPTVLRAVARTVGELRGITDELRSSTALLEEESTAQKRSAARRRARAPLTETEIDLVKSRKTAAARREAASAAAELPSDPSPTGAEERLGDDVMFRRDDLDAPGRPVEARRMVRPAEGAVARGGQTSAPDAAATGDVQAPPPLEERETGGVS